MAEATKTIVMGVPIEKLWQVILDYEKYPQFVEGASRVRILKNEPALKRVEYSISLLGKDIVYVLDHKIEAEGSKMSWSMVESNILKANHGYWGLVKKSDASTEVTYQLALEFKIYVPGMILNGLVKSSLPKMLESFEKRTQETL